jgi:hypothetical protein
MTMIQNPCPVVKSSGLSKIPEVDIVVRSANAHIPTRIQKTPTSSKNTQKLKSISIAQTLKLHSLCVAYRSKSSLYTSEKSAGFTPLFTASISETTSSAKRVAFFGAAGRNWRGGKSRRLGAPVPHDQVNCQYDKRILFCCRGGRF